MTRYSRKKQRQIYEKWRLTPPLYLPDQAALAEAAEKQRLLVELKQEAFNRAIVWQGLSTAYFSDPESTTATLARDLRAAQECSEEFDALIWFVQRYSLTEEELGWLQRMDKAWYRVGGIPIQISSKLVRLGLARRERFRSDRTKAVLKYRLLGVASPRWGRERAIVTYRTTNLGQAVLEYIPGRK